MRLKSIIKSLAKKSEIPQISKSILKNININKRKNYFNFRMLTLQISSILIFLIGFFIFINNFQSNIYAFSNYDEVLMNATKIAYSYEEMEEEQSLISITTFNEEQYIKLLREEMPMLSKFVSKFESILFSNKKNYSKSIFEKNINYSFNYMDFNNESFDHDIKLSKKFRNNNEDRFDFNGKINSEFEFEGSTDYDQNRHLFNIEIRMKKFTFNISYDDESREYKKTVFFNENHILEYYFVISYDKYDLPKVEIDYTRENSNISIIISRNFKKKGIKIEYDIDKDILMQGYMIITLKGKMKYNLEIFDDSGISFEYDYYRPFIRRRLNNF